MNGIILLNKPAGLSSNSAVNLVKKFIGAKKAGHLGTLDVLGEGVLPVTLGKATRLFDFFLTKTKTYRAVFIFGFETETLDSEGKILKHNNCDIPRKKIEQILNKFVGETNASESKGKSLNVHLKKNDCELVCSIYCKRYPADKSKPIPIEAKKERNLGNVNFFIFNKTKMKEYRAKITVDKI